MPLNLNRYSLELNFNRGNLSVVEFINLARNWGFDGVQLHISKGGPRVCLSGESQGLFFLSTLDDDLDGFMDVLGKVVT